MADLATLAIGIEVDYKNLTRLSSELKRADVDAKTLTKTADKQQRQFMQLAAQHDQYTKAIERALKAGKLNNQEGARLISMAARSASALNSAARSYETYADRVRKAALATSALSTANQQAARSVNNLGQAFQAVKGFIAGQAVVGLTRNIIQLGNAFDRTQTQFTIATGSLTKANREMEYVKSTAKELGLNFFGLADAYAQLSVSSKGTVLEGQKTRDLFTSIAKTSAVMRFNLETTRGVMLAFQQMMAKGTVQSQELRLQLGNRLPIAYDLFVAANAKLQGKMKDGEKVTQEMRAEFEKLMRTGQIASETILPQVAKELEAIFGPGAARNANSAFAEINRMINAFQELANATWIGGIQDAVANVSRAFTELAGNEGIRELATSFGSTVAKVTALIIDATRAVGDLAGSFLMLEGVKPALIFAGIAYGITRLLPLIGKLRVDIVKFAAEMTVANAVMTKSVLSNSFANAPVIGALGRQMNVAANETGRLAANMTAASASGRALALVTGTLVGTFTALTTALFSLTSVFVAAAAAAAYLVFQHYEMKKSVEAYLRTHETAVDKNADLTTQSVAQTQEHIDKLKELTEARRKDYYDQIGNAARAGLLDPKLLARDPSTLSEKEMATKREMLALLARMEAVRDKEIAGLEASTQAAEEYQATVQKLPPELQALYAALLKVEKSADPFEKFKSVGDTEIDAQIKAIDHLTKSTTTLNAAQKALLVDLRSYLVMKRENQTEKKEDVESTQRLTRYTNELSTALERSQDVLAKAGESKVTQIYAERNKQIREAMQAYQGLTQAIADKETLEGHSAELDAARAQAREQYLQIIRNQNLNAEERIDLIQRENHALADHFQTLEQDANNLARNREESYQLNLQREIAIEMQKAETAAYQDYMAGVERSMYLTGEERLRVIELTKAREDNNRAMREAVAEAEKWDRLFNRFKNNIRRSSEDFWDALMQGGEKKWNRLFNQVFRSFSTLLGDMYNEFMFSPLLDGFRDLMKGGAGGTTATSLALGVTGAAGVVGQTTGGIKGNAIASAATLGSLLMGGGGSLLSNAALGHIGTGVLRGAQGLGFSTAASQGAAMSAVGGLSNMGFGAFGSLGANLLGLGGGTGGAAGGMIGSFIGGMTPLGPLGAIIGGFLGTALGGLLNGKPSDKTQSAFFDAVTNTSGTHGATGNKFSQQNLDAASTIIDTARQMVTGLEDVTGGRFSTSGVGLLSGWNFGENQIAAKVGSRDGIDVAVGGMQQHFATDEFDQIGDWIAKQIVQGMVDLPADVKTAMDHIDWAGDLQDNLELLKFAKDFQSTINSMNGGIQDFKATAKDAAAQGVTQLVQQIKDFKEKTAALGLDTGAAAEATKHMVEVLIGLKSATEPQSELAVALATLEGRFEAIGPLLEEVGIAASDAAGLLTQAKNALRETFDASIVSQLLPNVGKVQALISARNANLGDATLLGANIANVNLLFAKQMRELTEGLNRQDLMELSTYFQDVPEVVNAISAAVAKIATDFDKDIARQLQDELHSGDAMYALNQWLTDTLKAALASGGNLYGVFDLYNAKLVNLRNEERVDLLEKEADAVKDTIDALKKYPETLRNLRDSLLTDPNLSPLGPGERLAEARRQFEEAVANTSSTDRQKALNAYEKLPDLSKRLLEESKSYYASSEGYFQDFQRVSNVLGDTANKADAAIAIAQEQLNTLNQIRDALTKPTGGATGGSAATNYKTAADLDRLGNDFVGAKAAANAAGVADHTFYGSSTFQNIQSQVLGTIANLSPGAGDIQRLKDSVASGLANQNDPVLGSWYKQVADAATSRLQYFKVPGYADGGLAGSGVKMVGEQGPELMVSGAARFFSATKTLEMLQNIDGKASIGAINQQTDIIAAGFQGVWSRLDSINENLEGMRREMKR